MAQKLTVVVTGSTGKQGGAFARGLLERGHKVRAVTRDPNSSQAKSLTNAGATLVVAALEGTAAIKKALEGATSFFAMTMPSGGTDAETKQGIAAADAAKAAGVHLVFTSVGSATRRTGIPHFDSKYEVEKHIAKVGVRATILAPVSFMENLYFAKEQLAKGIYAAALPPTRALAQVAFADIGAVAVRVLEDAGRFTGKRFDLASDELTGNDALAFSRALPDAPLAITRSRSMSSASAWGRMPSGCMNGSTASVLSWIAPRSAVSFPTLTSTILSLGRRRRIKMHFCRAHRGRHRRWLSLHETACGAPLGRFKESSHESCQIVGIWWAVGVQRCTDAGDRT
jgi:uncharacterized protein YbjT (DUF2867 family)